MSEVNRIVITQPETGPDAPKAPEAPKVDRPAWLPENFKSPEDMAKAFKDTQAELTRIKQGAKAEPVKAIEPVKDEAGNPDNSKATEEPKAAIDDLTVQKAPEVPALDMEVFNAEYAKEGKLADTSYEKLAKMGINKDIVDAYIEGQKVLSERIDSDAYAAAGGKEEFELVRQWLSSNAVTDEQRVAFNKAVTKGSPKAERMQGINAAVKSYRDANGYEGTMIHGSRGSVSEAYGSMQEQVQDQRDPRYDKDSAFRAKVEAKIRRSRY